MSGVIIVECLHCRHVGELPAGTLTALGMKPNAPIASFVKRLRCSKYKSGSVMVRRTVRPLGKRRA